MATVKLKKIKLEVSEKLFDAWEVFKNNSFFSREFNTAPSKECAMYLLYTYANSVYGLEEEEIDELNDIADTLTIEDWEHIGKFAGPTPFGIWVDEHIDELKAAQGIED